MDQQVPNSSIRLIKLKDYQFMNQKVGKSSRLQTNQLNEDENLEVVKTSYLDFTFLKTCQGHSEKKERKIERFFESNTDTFRKYGFKC